MKSYGRVWGSSVLMGLLLFCSMTAQATLMRYTGDLMVSNINRGFLPAEITEFQLGDSFSFQFDIEDSNLGGATRSGLLQNFSLTKTGEREAGILQVVS